MVEMESRFAGILTVYVLGNEVDVLHELGRLFEGIRVELLKDIGFLRSVFFREINAVRRIDVPAFYFVVSAVFVPDAEKTAHFFDSRFHKRILSVKKEF